MKKHGNTLYVTTQGTYISRERETLVLRLDDDQRRRFPIHGVGGLVCFGNVSFSPFALGLCAENGVSVSLLSDYGRFLARVEGPTTGNVLLRRRQYQAADDAHEAANVARAIVAAKVANARTALLRARRDHPDAPGADAVARAVDELADVLRQLAAAAGLDDIRGLEGQAARAYFAVFDTLIRAPGDAFRFTGRTRRPPLDNVNALLSFLYVLLAHDARSACESVGLDPQVGFLHRVRPGRASLALDLMEELRCVLADRLALSLINRQQVDAAGFRTTESGAVEMNDKTRKAVLVAYQKRKADELEHPFLKEKVTVGLIVHVQARLLGRFLRGDLDAYPPFFWR